MNNGFFSNAYLGLDGRWVIEAGTGLVRKWVKNTLVFNTFVFLQIFNEFNSRRINFEWNIFENVFVSPVFIGIFVFTLICQISIVEIGLWEVGSVIFQTTGLAWWHWLGSISLAMGCIPFHFLKTAIMRFIIWGVESGNFVRVLEIDINTLKPKH